MQPKSRYFSALLLAIASATAFAQTALPVRLRGKIDAVDAQSVTMTTREGKVIKLALSKDTKYSYVKAMNMADIKSGSFIGAAGKPAKDGGIEALEVVVFPDERRGTGEGHYAWDLLPDSSMTNATVAAVAQSSSGQELNLVYKDGTKKVTVPKGVPIVTILDGSLADVRKGETAFVVATPKDADNYTTARIVVGKDGVAPPM